MSPQFWLNFYVDKPYVAVQLPQYNYHSGRSRAKRHLCAPAARHMSSTWPRYQINTTREIVLTWNTRIQVLKGYKTKPNKHRYRPLSDRMSFRRPLPKAQDINKDVSFINVRSTVKWALQASQHSEMSFIQASARSEPHIGLRTHRPSTEWASAKSPYEDIL